jgi:hypothetical protein
LIAALLGLELERKAFHCTFAPAIKNLKLNMGVTSLKYWYDKPKNNTVSTHNTNSSVT